MLLKEYVGLLKESALDLEVFLRDRKGHIHTTTLNMDNLPLLFILKT